MRKAVVITLLTAIFMTAGHIHAADKLYSGDEIKVLHVTGGTHHDYKSQCQMVPKFIKERGDFKVDVIGPDWANAQIKLKEKGWAKGYDVVVYNICDAFNADTNLINGLAKVHLEEGVPAVVIHAALHSFHWKLGKDRTKFEGEEWVKVLGMVSANHGQQAGITVRTLKPDHPVMKGLPSEWKTEEGELYNCNELLPTATALAEGDNGAAQQGKQVCIWTNESKDYKLFGTSLGHHNSTIQNETFGNMVVRGILWSCGKLK